MVFIIKTIGHDVGNILTKDDIINFDLDGLQDTHHIYRINTEFDKVLANAKAVIDSSMLKFIGNILFLSIINIR